MFEYSLLHWSPFLTAAILLNISPGPDLMFILGQTIRGGKKAGLAATSGIWVGALCHVFFAAAGLSAILAASAFAFSIVKWCGVLYLIWLGISAFRSQSISLTSDEPAKTLNLSKIFQQGILVCLFNPKVAVFFLAFLPQFVVVGAGDTSAQLFLHGILLVAIGACVEVPLIFAAEKLTQKIRSSPKIGLWMDRALGSIFIGLGIKLGLEEN